MPIRRGRIRTKKWLHLRRRVQQKTKKTMIPKTRRKICTRKMQIRKLSILRHLHGLQREEVSHHHRFGIEQVEIYSLLENHYFLLHHIPCALCRVHLIPSDLVPCAGRIFQRSSNSNGVSSSKRRRTSSRAGFAFAKLKMC